MKPLRDKKQPKIPPQWWKGGTLGDSNLGEWNQATFGNGLATASAWVYEFDKFANKTGELLIRNSKTGELDPVKYLAASLQLVNAISLSSQDKPDAWHLRTAELALLAAYTMGWLDDSQGTLPSLDDPEIQAALVQTILAEKG
jgi:hypothetical protein